MKTSILLTTTACGTFFLTALLSGIWKWRAMLASPEHQAPHYVDIGHRAALLYSFACLVIIHFLELSPLPEPLNVAAAAAPLLFFAIAIASYLVLGYLDHTDNQFSERTFATTTGMVLLAAAEVGGFGLLFVGFLVTQLA